MSNSTTSKSSALPTAAVTTSGFRPVATLGVTSGECGSRDVDAHAAACAGDEPHALVSHRLYVLLRPRHDLQRSIIRWFASL
jgi:hypothetical protein